MSFNKCLEFTDSVLLSCTSPHLTLKLFSGKKKEVKSRKGERRRRDIAGVCDLSKMQYITLCMGTVELIPTAFRSSHPCKEH